MNTVRNGASCLLLAFLLTANGCGGGDGDPSPATLCNPADPVGSGVRALSQSNITKDPCQTDFPEAIVSGSQGDARIQATFPITNGYDFLIARLKQQASIASSVTIRVTPDLECFQAVGGGLTGFDLVYIDGKFLDILSEYATYRALAQANATAVDRTTAINLIVAHHQSAAFRCRNGPTPPGQFIRNNLSSALLNQADGILDSLAGAITYHEYGHFWAHAISDSLLLNVAQGLALYYFPSKVEDDADLIAGVLTKKTGHNLALAQEMIDLMAFYYFHRNYGVPSILNIEQSYQAQFAQLGQDYSALAQRKSLIAQGYQVTP